MKTNSLFLNTSRYVHGGSTEIANDRVEWWEKKSFPSDETDQIYVVENIYEGNPQAISTVFYGEPRYWWFIAQFNNILDPVTEITAGRILSIPTKDRMILMLTGRQGGFASERELIPIIPPVII
jgi:hypothetical protein